MQLERHLYFYGVLRVAGRDVVELCRGMPSYERPDCMSKEIIMSLGVNETGRLAGDDKVGFLLPNHCEWVYFKPPCSCRIPG